MILETVRQKRTYKKSTIKKSAMLDTSRLMLCMFVMSVMFFNPFNLILSTKNSEQLGLVDTNKFNLNEGVNSRVLNSIDIADSKTEIKNDENLSQTSYKLENSKHESHLEWNFNFIASWTFNALLILFCLIRIYINGEPYMELDSSSVTSVWLNYQKASKNFQRKNYQEAFNYCCNGLNELGQKNIPKTKAQLIIGIIWQSIRLILDKLYIGKLFFKLGVWYYGIKSMKLYKISSLFYY